MSRVRSAFPAIAVASIIGCAPQTQFVATNASPRALTPRDVAQVAVFTMTAPERAYAEVAS